MVGGRVGGTEIVVVGAGCVVCVVVGVGSGGGWVVAVMVCAGGEVVPGALVPKFGGAVVATKGWMTGEPPDGMVTTVVVLESTVDDVDVGFDDVVGPGVVEVGRAVVVVGDRVATCSLGDVSPPVATSKSMAARAKAART